MMSWVRSQFVVLQMRLCLWVCLWWNRCRTPVSHSLYLWAIGMSTTCLSVIVSVQSVAMWTTNRVSPQLVSLLQTLSSRELWVKVGICRSVCPCMSFSGKSLIFLNFHRSDCLWSDNILSVTDLSLSPMSLITVWCYCLHRPTYLTCAIACLFCVFNLPVCLWLVCHLCSHLSQLVLH